LIVDAFKNVFQRKSSELGLY